MGPFRVGIELTYQYVRVAQPLTTRKNAPLRRGAESHHEFRRPELRKCETEGDTWIRLWKSCLVKTGMGFSRAPFSIALNVCRPRANGWCPKPT